MLGQCLQGWGLASALGSKSQLPLIVVNRQFNPSLLNPHLWAQDTYVGSPILMVPSARQTISRRAPSMNWASQPMLPTKKHALT